MRRIGVVTVGRSDYGYYVPILRAIEQDPTLRLCLIVSGAHLVPTLGHTVDAIEADGFPIAERVPVLTASDNPEGITQAMGLALIGFGGVYARQVLDVVLLLGDRFEMHAAALAALPFKLPLAHIHGGEETVGAIDNSLRHSISKLSHLHFAATDSYARRLIQMGEEPWRVLVTGAPSLDNLKTIKLLTTAEIKKQFSIECAPPPLLVTFHPVTLEHEQAEWQAAELLGALQAVGMPVVFTMPNADTGGRLIRKLIEQGVSAHPGWHAVENLGTQGYFSIMACAAAMVGNSSSGIIEAPSFRTPVVDIGTRQAGRISAENVIHVGYERSQIVGGIREAINPEFRRRISQISNPYGDGNAASRIVERLKAVPLDSRLLYKPFFDAALTADVKR